ncbi:hypothetical protein [Geomonas propionica]|uniref:Uncharacterized protein n=1 Tax=Geomonas propionica TaxID=2798582 RepID=A0ABS0YNG0_9BACT|nr:hypothetical protein [Geomonas propionica]MBJ6799025.1 hypothetical protein [Geomonas propionica]
MRQMPEAIIYSTVFLMTVSFVICGIFFSSNKSLGIWSLFSGIVFGVLTVFLYWQSDIWKIQANKEANAQTKPIETKVTVDTHISPRPKKKSKTSIKTDTLLATEAHQTAYSPLNNDQLKKEVLNLVEKMRNYLERKHLQDQTKSDYYFNKMREAKTEGERQLIWDTQTHDSQTSTPLNFEYSEKFKADATLIHDELLKRLPSEPKDRPGMRADYEHPTNPIGLNMLIDDLERLAKSLPK